MVQKYLAGTVFGVLRDDTTVGGGNANSAAHLLTERLNRWKTLQWRPPRTYLATAAIPF